MMLQNWGAVAVIVGGYLLGIYFQNRGIAHLDKRIDDVNKRIDDFKEVLRAEIRALKAEILAEIGKQVNQKLVP